MSKKSSFFDRLMGSHVSGDVFDSFDEELEPAPKVRPQKKEVQARSHPMVKEDELPAGDGQLPVDVHQTANEIVIRAFVAGVRPDEISISISRDMVELSGSRMEREQIPGPDYFTRELFWGSFSRTILLPQEIDVDNSVASAKDGLVTIVLPKLDRTRQTKLRVKAG